MGRLEESFDNPASALTFAPIYKGSTKSGNENWLEGGRQ